MGGIPCVVDRQAILRFQDVPTAPVQQAAFDDQIRQLYAHPHISQAISDDVPAEAGKVCDTLGKASFTQDDRKYLMATLNKLWPGYS